MTVPLRLASLGTSPVRTGEDDLILPCEAGEVSRERSERDGGGLS
jgi:hypothetical protein